LIAYVFAFTSTMDRSHLGSIAFIATLAIAIILTVLNSGWLSLGYIGSGVIMAFILTSGLSGKKLMKTAYTR